MTSAMMTMKMIVIMMVNTFQPNREKNQLDKLKEDNAYERDCER